LESKEVSEDPLDILSPSYYDKGDDFVDNIDEFIQIGKHKWVVIGYDGRVISKSCLHNYHMRLLLVLTFGNKEMIWLQMISKHPRGDLALCSHDDFRSYLEDFDEYSSKHLNLVHEEDYQPPLCSDIDKGEDIACPEKDPCDKVFQLPSTTLSRYVTKGVVGKHVLGLKFSPGQSLLLEFKGRLNT
jgi:hypothetical protein